MLLIMIVLGIGPVSIPSFSRVSEAFTRREIGFERGDDRRQDAVYTLGHHCLLLMLVIVIGFYTA